MMFLNSDIGATNGICRFAQADARTGLPELASEKNGSERALVSSLLANGVMMVLCERASNAAIDIHRGPISPPLTSPRDSMAPARSSISSADALSKRSGRKPGMAREKAIEIGRIGKAKRIADVGHGQITV